jgi:HEPN/RES N-terminal domain 1
MTKMHANVPLEAMLERFHNHYEDAAHGVFYDGREGGYQYLPGTGPCDPLEVLQKEFPDADPEVLREAADKLLSEGNAWVKKGVY